jgi:hypothetical protein
MCKSYPRLKVGDRIELQRVAIAQSFYEVKPSPFIQVDCKPVSNSLLTAVK